MADPLDAAVLGRLVAARAEAEPDRCCLVLENGDLPAERLTNAEIAVQSNKLSHALRSVVLRKGDRAAVMLRNHPEFVYALVACSKPRLATVPVDPRARREAALLHYLRRVRGRAHGGLCRGRRDSGGCTAHYRCAYLRAVHTRGRSRGAGAIERVAKPERGARWPGTRRHRLAHRTAQRALRVVLHLGDDW